MSLPNFPDDAARLQWFSSVAEATARPESLREATSLLVAFRNSEAALATARATLLRSTDGHVVFHGIATLQHAAALRWSQLCARDREGLRRFALECLNARHEQVPAFVRPSLVRLVAVLWKLDWASLSAEARQGFLAQLRELARQGRAGDQRSLGMATAVLRALVEEFAGLGALGVALEVHLEARRAFERQGLTPVLGLAMELMSAALGVGGAAGFEDRQVYAVVRLAVEVLSWDFRPDYTAAGGSSLGAAGSALIEAPAAWREHLVRPETLGAVFELYMAHRGRDGDPSALLHELRQLLVQLASLSGAGLYTSEEERAGYAAFLLEGTLGVLQRPLVERGPPGHVPPDADERAGRELVDVCTLVVRLLRNFGARRLLRHPTAGPLFSGLAQLQVQLLGEMRQAYVAQAQAGSDAGEEGWRGEVGDLILDAWELMRGDVGGEGGGSRIAEATGAGPEPSSVVREVMPAVFEAYIAYALGRAEAEGVWSLQHEEDDVDIGGEAQNAQIQVVCQLARARPMVTAEALHRVLCDPAEGVLPAFTALVCGEAAAVAVFRDPMTALAVRLERVRVGILFLGHFIADDADDVSTAEFPFDGLRDEDAAVFVQKLAALSEAALSFVGGELQRLRANPEAESVSPYIHETLAWLLSRWANTYLCRDRTAIAAGSMGFRVAELFARFGVAANFLASVPVPSVEANPQRPVPPGVEALDFVLRAAYDWLAGLPHQPGLVEQTVQLLGVLISDLRPLACLYAPFFYRLLQLHAEALALPFPNPHLSHRSAEPHPHHLLRLSGEARGGLARLLAKAIATGLTRQDAGRDVAAGLEAALVDPLVARAEGFRRGEVAPGLRPLLEAELEALAAMIGGAARGAADAPPDGAARLVVRLGIPLGIVVEAARRVAASERSIGAVMRLLKSFCDASSLIPAANEQLRSTTATALTLFQAYCAARGDSAAAAAVREDEDEDALLPCLEFLNALSARDMLGAGGDLGEALVLGMKVGLTVLQSSPELLRRPQIARTWFSLTEDVCESNLSGLCRALAPWPETALGFVAMLVMGALELDFGSGSKSACAALEAIASGAMHRPNAPARCLVDAVPDLLGQAMEAILQTLTREGPVDGISSALLMLIQADAAGFTGVCERAIAGQQDDAKRQRLAAAFGVLVGSNGVQLGPGAPLRMDRGTKARFRENLRAFARDARSFLQQA